MILALLPFRSRSRFFSCLSGLGASLGILGAVLSYLDIDCGGLRAIFYTNRHDAANMQRLLAFVIP